jgi:ribonuclease HI
MEDTPVLRIHTDGASRGNPGPAAYAYVIARDGQADVEEAGRLGRMTNNQAEYEAVVRALEHALEWAADHRVVLHSDSELLVKQMRGEYRVKNPDLRDLYEQARELCAQFPRGVSFRHVPRGQNSRADALGNEALDGLREPTPRGTAPAKPTAPGLRDEALSCLRKTGAEPSAEAVWDELVEILRRHGVALPGR